MKIAYIDCQTTGTNAWKHDIIQLSIIIEIDSIVVSERTWRIKPYNMNTIEKEALRINQTTIEELEQHPDGMIVLTDIIEELKKFISPYDTRDKLYPAGHNVRFDRDFLKAFFTKHNNKYFGSFFWYKDICLLNIMYWLEYMNHIDLDNYKLGTICEYLDVDLDRSNSLGNIRATREAIHIVRDMITVID